MTKSKSPDGARTSRRKFLSGAAVATAATVAAPAVVKAQGPVSMRWLRAGSTHGRAIEGSARQSTGGVADARRGTPPLTDNTDK